MSIQAVTSHLSGQQGRFLLQARDQHLVVDASQTRGGPGEAWQAAELLMGALVTCSNAVITEQARLDGVALPALSIDASCEPDPDQPGHYRFIQLNYLFSDTSQTHAEKWVNQFKLVCPIYGSLSRGAPVSITVCTQSSVS